MKFIKKTFLAIVIAASLSGPTGCDMPSLLTIGVQFSNPLWAPPYHAGVRYYYLPDVEVYYDLSNREFVYLDNGRWLFTPVLPSIYSAYDLYNGFVIALNINVYQPWMHHQYYVYNYPRYYYHNVYRNMDIRTVRGFNENDRKPIYWKQEDRDRVSDLRNRDRDVKRPEVNRPAQKTDYYGKNIGRPVRVKSNMKIDRKKAEKDNKPKKKE